MESFEKDEKTRMNIWVSSDIVHKLQIIKKETGRSLLDLVREALWLFVRKWEQENDNERK